MLKRKTWLVDTGFSLGLACLSAPVTADMGGTTGGEWAWFAALHLALVWRTRQPVLVFWTVAGVALLAAQLQAFGPSLIIVPLVAGYTLARWRPPRDLWPAAAAPVPFVVLWLVHGGPWWDILALTAMFGAAILLGINLRTRQAHLAGLEAQARRVERARIAREVHDILAHNLAVMVALADGAAATVPTAPQRAVDMMDKTAQTGREALTEVRRLVGLLREDRTGEGFAPLPGTQDLDHLVRQARAAGLNVDLSREGIAGDCGPGIGLTVYRVVQEALTNTMKHAGPHACARVRLRYLPSGVDIEAVDDGGARRAGRSARATGNGLAGMAERVLLYGGHLDAGPGPDGGWRVHARLPLRHNEAT